MSSTAISTCANVEAIEMQTRLVYPFILGKNHIAPGETDLDHCIQLLSTQSWTINETPRPLWEVCVVDEGQGAEGLYQQELLPGTKQFLFGGNFRFHHGKTKSDDVKPEVSRRAAHERSIPVFARVACCYLRINPEIAKAWFQNTVVVRYPKLKSKADRSAFEDPHETIDAALVFDPGIELFLSPFGVGVVSLPFRPILAKDERWDPAILKRFNYQLAQLQKQKASDLIVGARSPLPLGAGLSDETEFSSRIGHRGASFRLAELMTHLLAPLDLHFGVKGVQQQFCAYTVLLFGAECDLGQESSRDKLAPLLSGLAQVEEALHAGAPEGHIDTPNALLNRHHWAAASSIGAAHIISHQAPLAASVPHPYNTQRLPSVRDKYFIAFLAAQFERLAIERFAMRASELLPFASDQQAAEFQRLREDILVFSVGVAVNQISTRRAVNRFYHLAQEGFDLKDALTDMRLVIEGIDKCRQAARDAQIKDEVGILEAFFVLVYATELGRLLGDGFGFKLQYTAFTALLWGVLLWGMAVMILKLRRPLWDRVANWWGIGVAAVSLTVLALWIWAGSRWFHDIHK